MLASEACSSVGLTLEGRLRFAGALNGRVGLTTFRSDVPRSGVR